VPDKIRLGSDRSLETHQTLAGDASFLQGFVKAFEIAVASKEFEIGFANDDVVGGCIIMELLVPLLQKVTAHFLDMVPVHYLQDFVSNPLTVSATPNRREHKPVKGQSRLIGAI